jgi:HEAT repeat protein
MVRWRFGRDELRRIDSLEVDQNVAGLIAELANQTGAGRHAIRGDAALALGRIGNSQAAPYLADLARRDPDEIVRMEAIWALGRISGRDEVSSFIHSLDDPAAIVRMAAAKELRPLRESSAIPRLRYLVNEDPDAYVRFSAAEALVELGDGDVWQQIPGILRNLPWRFRLHPRYKALKRRSGLR